MSPSAAAAGDHMAFIKRCFPPLLRGNLETFRSLLTPSTFVSSRVTTALLRHRTHSREPHLQPTALEIYWVHSKIRQLPLWRNNIWFSRRLWLIASCDSFAFETQWQELNFRTCSQSIWWHLLCLRTEKNTSSHFAEKHHYHSIFRPSHY